MNSLEIRDKKAQLKQRMKDIVSTCKTEIREMSEEELNEYNAAKEEIAKLNAELEALKEKLAKYESDIDTTDTPTEEVEENKRHNQNSTMKEFKLVKAINDIANNRQLSEEYKNYIESGAEEMRKAGLSYAGQIQLRADVVAGTTTQGAELVATDKAPIVEAIKNNLVLTEAGATYMTNLVGNVSIPTYDGSSCTWADEVAAATDGAGTFGEVELSPKRLTCFVDISKQMLNQSSSDVEAMLRSDIVNAISQKLESTILGDGAGTTNTPAGIFNTVAPSAGVKDYAGILKMEEAFEGKTYGNKVWIVSPSVKSALKAKDKGTDTGNYLIQNGEMDGYKVICSANVAKDHFVFGDFSDLVIAQWGSIDLTVDPYSQATNGKIRLVVNAYFDAKLRRTSSVATAKTIA